MATSITSGSILGVGMWFWIIIATGILVATSQFFPLLRPFGSVAALLLGIISVFAVLLTLLAATIGGSFELDSSETLLVFSFTMIAVFGFPLVFINKKMNDRHED